MIKEQLNIEKTILVTGVAGFIGFHLAKWLLSKEKVKVVGLDNMNEYYDISLKVERKSLLENLSSEKFIFIKGSISDVELVNEVFRKYKPQIVVNLAAQAGVRYSIINPNAYIESNIIGFYNILEACRHSYDNSESGVEHLVYASSSSVYGGNIKVPYSTADKVDNPVSLYAATKKSDELLAHAYSKLYSIPTTGLRFFTVYGPYGRPDMAYFKFTNKIVKGEKIQIYNYGDMYRDFTYVDDIVQGIVSVMKRKPIPNECNAPYKIYNIGNNKPQKLMDFVSILEKCLLEEGITKKKAEIEFLPMQPGDVYQTYANIDDLVSDFNFKPDTDLYEGIKRYARWYKEYYML